MAKITIVIRDRHWIKTDTLVYDTETKETYREQEVQQSVKVGKGAQVPAQAVRRVCGAGTDTAADDRRRTGA